MSEKRSVRVSADVFTDTLSGRVGALRVDCETHRLVINIFSRPDGPTMQVVVQPFSRPEGDNYTMEHRARIVHEGPVWLSEEDIYQALAKMTESRLRENGQ